MEFDSSEEEAEEPPTKRPHLFNGKSSTPVKQQPDRSAAMCRLVALPNTFELDTASASAEDDGACGAAGQREAEVEEREPSQDVIDEEGPDYFGLSREDMESFIEEVEAEELEMGGGMESRRAELPTELWQLVFQRVPLLDLVMSGRRVCQQWNQIIQDEGFLRWQKLYFRLKHCDPDAVSQVTSILCPLSVNPKPPEVNGQWFTQAGTLINTTPNFKLIHLARLFGAKFSGFDIDSDAVLLMMSKHPQYSCVARIKEQLQDSDGPNLGALESLLLLVACCTSVHQVLLLIHLLRSPMAGGFSQPSLGYKEMSEMFHAMATFFLFLWNSGSLPPRFHYNVFYSLDVIQRSSFIPPLCQQAVVHPSLPSSLSHNASFSNDQDLPLSQNSIDASISCSQGSQMDYTATYNANFCEADDITMTSEQARVVVHPITRGEVLKVVAFAGTGKTTTLVQFAKRNSHLSIGYCVFNKSVQENASEHVFKDCRENVECKTFHSIAFGYVGRHYKEKAGVGAKNPFVDLNTFYLSEHVSDPPKLASLNKTQSLYAFAKYVKGTLENYFASTDREILREHIPRYRHSDSVRAITSMLEETVEDELADSRYVTRILEETRKIWKRMKNKNDCSVRMSHDGYLKLFQLAPVDFAEKNSWDILLVDEAQDLTPAIIDLIGKTTCAKIFVGDPHQQIYSFRGATGAMPLVRADRTFYLTRSFRFGPEIAYVSALLLRTLKRVRQQTLVGSTEEGCVYGTREFGQVTVIARTNLGLFEEMAKVLRLPGGDTKRLGFVGGINSYDFKSLEAIYFLLQGNRYEAIAKHHIGKRFKSFYELQQYAEHSDDIQLQLKIKICLTHSSDLLQIIGQLRKQKVDDLSFADVIFATAHKSKGLQFDNVMVVDDFLPNFDFQLHIDPGRISDDEKNLLYVAASRAKCQLILSPTCVNILERVAGESFVFPAASHEAPAQATASCVVCGTPFSNDCLLPRVRLLKPAFKLSTLSSLSQSGGGLVCRHCGYRTLPSFSFSF